VDSCTEALLQRIDRCDILVEQLGLLPEVILEFARGLLF
jgi:hypothetical protein